MRWRVKLGSAEIWGKKSARATLTRARACWKFANAAASCWLLVVARPSRRFNSGSPKSSHQEPRGRWAEGWAGFQSPALVAVAPAKDGRHGVGAQRRGPLVIRADGAAGEQQGKERQRPKAETRRPKEIRSPKAERELQRAQRRVDAAPGSPDPERCAGGSGSDFGFRTSDFLRISDFGFRISYHVMPARVGALRWRRHALTRWPRLSNVR